MDAVTAQLRTLRFYDRIKIRGTRMVIRPTDTDPCVYTGHEGLLAFLSMYLDYPDIKETHYKWDAESLSHLQHIMSCRYCMARVFSTPHPTMQRAATQAMARVGV